MILSDRDLNEALKTGHLVVEPLGPNAVQPSSIDLRVGNQFRVFANSRYPYIDVRQPMEDLTELVTTVGDEPFILHPGEFVLGTTVERVELPDDLVARLEGKSSLGKARTSHPQHGRASWMPDLGATSPSSSPMSPTLPITIYPGMKIGQISFFQMTSPAQHPYGERVLRSKYLDQEGPTAVPLLGELRDSE